MRFPELRQASRLFVMPNGGVGAAARLIEGARSSLLIKMVMNIDRSAFDLRREIGVVIGKCRAVDHLHRCFDDAKHYDAPDPMLLQLVTAIDHQPASAPPELSHE